MKPDSAKILVVVGVGTAVVGTTIKEILDGHRGPAFYVPLAGAMIAIPLLIVSDFSPAIAGGLAILILVTSLTYSGNAIMKAVNNATGAGQTTNLSNKIPNPFNK